MLYKEFSLICRYYAYKDGTVFQRIEFEMQCLLFYYTAWTFLESGAVVTDRATAASAAAPSAAGISQTDTVTECASVEEDENKEKVWTITAFGEDGIVSTRCQNGKIIDSWEIKYTNPNDAKKVQDFIGRFEKDANLIFSGSKDFWEEFLSSDMDADSIFAAHAEVFDKAAPDAPPIVKNAWMNAAKETGYLEGGKMNYISQLLVRQVINRENGVEDYQNVFGNSVASALQATKELLYDLENPLTPESERSESVRMYREQEKEFYRKFIENLEEISGIPCR